VPALVCRARAHILKRSLKSAVADLDRAIAINPDSHAAHMIRAWARNESGEHQKAYEDADRAVRLDPQHAEGYCQRGWANLGNRKYADAVIDLTKAIDTGDSAGWPYYLRGKAHKALGNTVAAEKDFATARKLDKNIPPPD
jgi:tetratricopeptide (TPR) repeat protein